MNPFRKIANSLMNWWKGETAPEVSDSTELTGGVMTLNSPSFLESMGLSRRRKAAKEELKELQEKFDLLFDLDEEEHEEIEDKVATGTAKTIGAKADKKNLVKAFVNIVKCGFLKREPDEGDVKVYKDALSTDTTKGDDDEMGIGVTVPEDIRTDIIELRRSEDNLEQYVNVEGVTTKSGSRNIEVDADSTPFDNVDEEADFPDMDEPKFKKIVYAIKKKGGILKITAELFEDTAANVMAYINKWIAKPIEDRGITVMQGWYDKDLNKCHVTLWDLGETDDNFSDDDAEGVTLSLQITIFSKEDEVELAREIKSLMKENGFSFEGRNGDDSKPEDGIYMKAQRFTKYYESEEKS